jgi:3-hydroxyacyl-[acyl-carrier-protein] dehydratase
MTDILYKLKKIEILRNSDHGSISADIELDVKHPVFYGHFPEKPILPGVCQLQIVHELLENALEKSLILKSSNRMKFTKFVDPHLDNNLHISITYSTSNDEFEVAATIEYLASECFRMKGIYKYQTF